MQQPSEQERKKRIKAIKVRQQYRAVQSSEYRDIHFLLRELSRREQEHQEVINAMEVAHKQAYDTLKGIILRGDKRHAEEIRKAKEGAWDDGHYAGETDSGKNPYRTTFSTPDEQ